MIIIVFAMLLGTKWFLSVVSICISLMTNFAEHHFMCLLAICISSLEKFPYMFDAIEINLENVMLVFPVIISIHMTFPQNHLSFKKMIIYR